MSNPTKNFLRFYDCTMSVRSEHTLIQSAIENGDSKTQQNFAPTAYQICWVSADIHAIIGSPQDPLGFRGMLRSC